MYKILVSRLLPSFLSFSLFFPPFFRDLFIPRPLPLRLPPLPVHAAYLSALLCLTRTYPLRAGAPINLDITINSFQVNAKLFAFTRLLAACVRSNFSMNIGRTELDSRAGLPFARLQTRSRTFLGDRSDGVPEDRR